MGGHKLIALIKRILKRRACRRHSSSEVAKKDYRAFPSGHPQWKCPYSKLKNNKLLNTLASTNTYGVSQDFDVFLMLSLLGIYD